MKLRLLKMSSKSKRHSLTVHIKQEIIKKCENGVKIIDIVRNYGLPHSTVSTILKQKEKIKAVKAAHAIKSTKIYSNRTLISEMEKALLIWIKDKQFNGEAVNQQFICEKAKLIFEDLKVTLPQTSQSINETFKASKGWFDRFRKRAEIVNVVRHDKTSSTDGKKWVDYSGEGAEHENLLDDKQFKGDEKVAEKFKVSFAKFIDQEGFRPQQVFNVNATGLFWKKIPKITNIINEEVELSGYNPTKDHLTLLFGGNASGDLKLKPLLVYHSESPRVFRQFRILKSTLGVLWKSNKNTLLTRTLFQEWLCEVFCPTVKSYLEKNKLPLKALLLLDNSAEHDPEMAANLEARFNFLNIKFLPPNTASLIQPIDRQVIYNFKKLFLKKSFTKCLDATRSGNVSLKDFWNIKFTVLDAAKLIVSSWSEVSRRCLNSSWKSLWPEIVDDCEWFGASEEAVVEEIISIGASIGLEVNKNDVEDFVADHVEELTDEYFQELEVLRKIECDSGMEEMKDDKHVISTEEIKSLLKAWLRIKEITSKYHPEIETTELMQCKFEDEIVSYFKNVQRIRQNRTIELFEIKEEN